MERIERARSMPDPSSASPILPSPGVTRLLEITPWLVIGRVEYGSRASLLEIVRTKELEIKSKIEKAEKESRRGDRQGETKSRGDTRKRETDGRGRIGRYIEEQERALEQEILEIKKESLSERNRIATIATGRTDEAVKFIVSRIEAKES